MALVLSSLEPSIHKPKSETSEGWLDNKSKQSDIVMLSKKNNTEKRKSDKRDIQSNNIKRKQSNY